MQNFMIKLLNSYLSYAYTSSSSIDWQVKLGKVDFLLMISRFQESRERVALLFILPLIINHTSLTTTCMAYDILMCSIMNIAQSSQHKSHESLVHGSN